MKRRNFIRSASLGTASIASMGFSGLQESTPRSIESKYMGGFAAQAKVKIKAAFIGLGYRGNDHLRNFASLPGTEVLALCDLYQDNVETKLATLNEIDQHKQHQKVKTYWGDENRWREMFEEVAPDVVFISTNWTNHAPMAITSMEKGAHTFVEVPLATSMEDLWKIVNTSERTQKHCMMLENVNYGRDELLFLNLCRKGYIGELLHAEAAYIHELRWQMKEEERGTGSWRTFHYAHGRGNLYPTHGLGPVAQYMNLARGEDTFKSLVSFSSPAKGRSLYAKKNFSQEHKWNQLDFANGDLNTSLIKTQLGRTIMIQWDETSPRPYTRHNLVQGTMGTLAGFPTRVAREGGVEGVTKDHHRWVQGEQIQMIYEKYDHPLYKRLNASTKNSGHGGMDGIMMYRIVECLQKGQPLDQNIYEGALWSAVGPLSSVSIAKEGMPQKFPDFTRGEWNKTSPLEIIK
jgi:predicted dehydrogenase